MTRKFPINNRVTQRGAVLVVSLIILLILTILGVSVMQTTTLEEKMAAATRNKDLAFQAAESALRAAEKEVSGMAGITGFDAVDTDHLWGPLAPDATQQRWENPAICGAGDIWACAKSKPLAGDDALDDKIYSKQPRYFVEILQTIGGTSSTLNMGNVGDLTVASAVTYYRVTAMGYGGTEDAQVVLQSTFGK